MLNNTQFSVLYPTLSMFSQGTYTRVRRGKTELVRKKKKKKGNKLVTTGGVIGGGLLGIGGLRAKAIGEARQLSSVVAKIDDRALNAMSQKQVKDLVNKNSGIILKTAGSKYGGLKLAAIPITTAIAGGVAAYRLSRKKKKKS